MNTQENQPIRPEVTAGYVPCGDAVLDDAITSAMQKYYEFDITNGSRTEFREKPVQERLHDICWRWGQDPQKKPESAQLKAQIFARALAKVALGGDTTQHERKGIPPLDDYWVQVDENLRQEIRGLTERNGGRYYHYILDHSLDQETNYLTLASIGNFNIYRSDLIRSGQTIHIEYLACHALRNVRALPR